MPMTLQKQGRHLPPLQTSLLSFSENFDAESSRWSITQLTRRLDAIAHTYLSVESLQSDSCSFSFNLSDIEKEVAITYADVCRDVWMIALSENAIALDEQRVAMLNASRSKLCSLWAVGKWNEPENSFFSVTNMFSDLQRKWRHADIRESLRKVAGAVQSHPSKGPCIERYPTCWSYTVGLVMHQILQWNYQLTSSQLRAFLDVNEGNNLSRCHK